jgi:histidinol dehydrogenase
MTIRIQRLAASEPDFIARLDALVDRGHELPDEVVSGARDIVNDVRLRGDAAVVEYTNRFDARTVTNASELELAPADWHAAAERVAPGVRDSLEAAATRIRAFHERQLQPSWCDFDADGNLLGTRITPLDRAGVYVPGGKAAYPSSVLMNIVPAKVAGVAEVVMVVPAPKGQLEPVVLAAAAIAGADRIFTIGGAQAVAALAWGTQTIPAVDKITGPGNAWVAAAKSLVFGKVGIDMVAGPSEIVVVSDGSAQPDWVAMDLCSQAEHDEEAQAILITPDAAHADAVIAALQRLVPTLERAAIVERSLAGHGAVVVVEDLDEAMALVNRIAPEHLELALDEPAVWVDQVRHAGAIFLGHHTAEALGDYCAGPNHVLPTAGTARFSSPLGVYDFQKRTSLIGCSPRSVQRVAHHASVLARAEGLTAHARSAEYRLAPAENAP